MTAQQDDPELRGPARLSAPRVPVVRSIAECSTSLAATLVVVVMVGLVTLRA